MKKILVSCFIISLFVFIGFFDNVYAFSAGDSFLINNVEMVNGNSTSNFSGSNSYSFTIQTLSYDLHNYYVAYFVSDSAEVPIVTVGGGCTYSCFNNAYYIKHIGFIRSSNYFALVLPRGKADCGVGSGICSINNNITISKSSNFVMYFLGAEFLDDDTIINNNYSGFLNVINNQNANTQSLINNFNNVNQSIIDSSNQQHQDMQDLNDTMTSEEAPSNNDVSSKVSEWESLNSSDAPISSMVLMPITLLNAFVNGMGSSCSPYNMGSLYGTDIVLPCIDLSSFFGANLWGVIDVLFSGFMIYAIGKKFVKIFNDFTNLRDNQIDELYGGGK